MRKPDPNSAAGLARAILGNAGKAVSKASLIRQITAKGHSVAAATKAIENLVTKKQAGRERVNGEVRYFLARAATQPAPAASTDSVSLGVVCRKAPQEHIAESREIALLGAFDADVALCLDELAALMPDWERSEIVQRLRSAITLGAVLTRYDSETRAHVYWLNVSGDEAPAARALASDDDSQIEGDQGPARMLDVSMHQGCVHDGSMVTARAQPNDAVHGSLGLRDRLDAIRQDIEDAIGDACDAELAHSLIKALVVAGGATNRALLVLGR